MTNKVVFIFLILTTVLLSSFAQETIQQSTQPSSFPTKYWSTVPSIIPSIGESDVVFPSAQPTIEYCADDPDYTYPLREFSNCEVRTINIKCDDPRINCDNRTPGAWLDNCCRCKTICGLGGYKCKDPVEISTSPTDGDSDCLPYLHKKTEDEAKGVPTVVIVFLVFCATLVCGRQAYKCHRERTSTRRAVQEIMLERRHQHRAHNILGLTLEERHNDRYELFVTKFHFQAVLPDKSNITANSQRKTSPSTNQQDEEHHHMDESSSVVGERQHLPLSERLSNWARQSEKDECCICLENYSEGETICAPKSPECNHVFHEECILEWLKTNDRCPLCRVELLE